MGISMSGNQTKQEGEHYISIINPNKKNICVQINTKAKILKCINFNDLWNNFLDSQASSFALTQSETTTLLKASYSKEKNEHDEIQINIDDDIKSYLTLIEELSPKDSSKMIDFMSLCSSILLLSELSIDMKADQIFEWICFSSEVFSFNDFFIALKSFERGISYALGFTGCSEQYIKTVAAQWMALADPLHKGSIDTTTLIDRSNFFSFCTNRQHVVRRLLESLSLSIVKIDENMKLSEVKNTIDSLSQEPWKGDEWLANPAWKKTAERMLLPEIKAHMNEINTKPSSNLSLEWVHGYRGFDCRNNLFYCNHIGSQIFFHAAGVSIVQDNTNNNTKDRTQTYFGEHGDDILCATSVSLNDNNNNEKVLIASGEIGKTPSIYLYVWNANSTNDKSASGSFTSLICLKGFHKKGVCQLAFSDNGSLLYSIGIEYTVAVYNCNQSDNKMFGKMLASSQGPKSQVLHICRVISSNNFISCGEKHCILWKYDETRGLTHEEMKLGTNRNKVILSAAALGPDLSVLGTSEGDLLSVTGTTVVELKLNTKGHEKKAINAIYAVPKQKLSNTPAALVTGDRDGKVIVWKVDINSVNSSGSKESSAASTATLTAFKEFMISGYSVPEAIEDATLSSMNNNNSTSTKKLNDKTKSKHESNQQLPTKSKTPSIRAVAFNNDLKKLLVGTDTCEVIEFELPKYESFLNNDPTTSNNLPIPKQLVYGHFKDEVWGLAIRPTTEENRKTGIVEYCTVGDDGYLRIWNLLEHRQICCFALGGKARACDYSPDGNYLAVGMGGRTGRETGKAESVIDGCVKIFRLGRNDTSSSATSVNKEGNTVGIVTLLTEIKESKKWISCVRYSPDGSTLAVGSRDNSVYLYSVMLQYKRKAKFTKHGAGINQLDFTLDSKYLQSCCSAYEILFSDANNGAQITDGATKLAKAEWSSWTCTLGWPVIGIWSGTLDGTDINAVDRSPSGKLLATSDDFGKVNVFRYPAIKDGGSQHSSYTGHSSHVTCVRWISLPSHTQQKSIPKTDDFLISLGGEDKCVFQWKNNNQHLDDVSKSSSQSMRNNSQVISFNVAKHHDNDDGDLFQDEGPGAGDEFTAVKPWLGAIVAPSAWTNADSSKMDPFLAALGEMSTQFSHLNSDVIKKSLLNYMKPPDENVLKTYAAVSHSAENVLNKMYESGQNNSAPPDSDELELDWVHGYRGYDSRNNVYYIEPKSNSNSSTSSKEHTQMRYVLYYAAALGILMDPITCTQKFFRGHTDDVVSMAIHKGTIASVEGDAIVATGQQGIGNIFIWEVPSMKTLAVLKTKQKNVHLIDFSKDGRYVISITENEQVAVCDWKSQTILSISGSTGSTSHSNTSLGPLPPIMHFAVGTNDALSFLTCGDKQIKFWSLNGRNLTSSKVSVGKVGSIQHYFSVAIVKSKFLIGCDDGYIYVVHSSGKTVEAKFPHHPPNSDIAKKGNTSVSTESSANKNKSKDTAISSIHVQQHDLTNKNTTCLLFTGCKDGSITVWDASDLESKDIPAYLYCFDISSLHVPSSSLLVSQIQSISMYTSASYISTHKENPIIIIGTRSCDLLELTINLESKSCILYASKSSDDLSSGVIMQSHCNNELWGVATHPLRPEFCTVGDDKTLRFYSVHRRKVLAIVNLGIIARTCDYNYDGTILAIGFGGRLGKGKEKGGGIVRLYSTNPYLKDEIKCLDEKTVAKEWISDVKFTSDGKTLAIGSHDCKIYIYDIIVSNGGAKMKLHSTFAKHNSVINHLDFSADGRFLQSNCSAYELLFCDVATGKQITSAKELRDVKWASWTCTLGWPVQGIWSEGMDGSDINAVARSHSGHLLATSDDLGQVNLFRYPVLKKGSGSLVYPGHSSHVMNVRWTVADEYLLSCGGNDKCLLQWRHVMRDVSGSSNSSSNESKVSINEVTSKINALAINNIASSSSSSTMFDEDDGPGAGDEAGAVKPWVGAIRAPKCPPPINPEAPNVSLDLKWIHGYSSSSSGRYRISSNLYYNIDSQPIYPAASHAVMLTKKNGTITNMKQSYFIGHDDEILCLAISPNRRFVATGQIASKALKGKASVIVWDALQNRLLCRMEGCHQRAVISLSFSHDNTQLLSVGQDDSNTHILWSDVGGGWSRVQKISTSPGDKAPLLFSRWVNDNNEMVKKGEYNFISGGPKGINFWKVEGSSLSKKPGRFSKKYKETQLLCAANIQGKDRWRMVIGTATGDLYIYDERETSDAVENAHKSAVLCLAEGNNCMFLVSGSKDHHVKVWNQALQPISDFNISSFSCVDASIASLDISPIGLQSGHLILLVGTYGGEVIEISSQKPDVNNNTKKVIDNTNSNSIHYDLTNANVDVLIYSHFDGELWGIATHPLDSNIFASVGDDSTLRIWSIKDNKMLKVINLNWPARCVAWHPSGQALAVGFHESMKGGFNHKGNTQKKSKSAKKATTKDITTTSSSNEQQQQHKGAIHLYSYKNNNHSIELIKKAEGCSSVAWIADIKFSPENGNILAAGSHDKRLYTYNIPSIEEIDQPLWNTCLDTIKYEFNKHSSAVIHFDFSLDEKYFQSNCQAGELLFSYVDTGIESIYNTYSYVDIGKQEPSATKLADYNGILDDENEKRSWSSQTCVLGWSVQGIWPPGVDNTEINAIDKHVSNKYIATADDSGHVKLFNYPCIQEKSKYVEFNGHSSHVTNVKWTIGNNLISSGGNDKCLFVWDLNEK